jgi:hypothetical protein
MTAAQTPARANPADLDLANQFRKDPRLVESKIKHNDNLNYVIEAGASGYPLPEKLEEVTHRAALFATVLVPQARAAVLVAKQDLAKAKNEDADGAAVRKAVRDGADVVTAVKLPLDKVAKAEKKLSEAERLEGAVRREERKVRAELHDLLRTREVVDVWQTAYKDLYIREADLEDLTMRQARAKREASLAGRPLLQALYELSLVSPTPKERRRLKEMFALNPELMPTIEDVRREQEEIKAATPAAREAKKRAEAKALERQRNKVAGAMQAEERLKRGDARLPNDILANQ